jgi:hypothetical protein
MRRGRDFSKIIPGLVIFLSAGVIASAGTISISYTGFAGGCLTSQTIPSVTSGITGLGTTTVVATADAWYSGNTLPSASDCLVTLSDELIVSGPAGATGYLSISLSGDEEGMVAPFYLNGVSEGACLPFGCQPVNQTIPITLGVPFTITLEANAAWAPPQQCCFGASDVQATIQAYEVIDSVPFPLNQTLSEVVLSPEPRTAWLVLPGVLLLGLVRFGRLASLKDSASPASAGSAYD